MAAPAVQEPVVYTPPAEIVGNAFARQYYEILEQSPELVYRFYQDMSKLGRPEESGAMGSTTTMEAINERIQSYGSLKAEVKFVDAQESYNGGVIVLVTGSMINVDGSRRGFTQTFFLAPQDKGYYVLNDIFRYVEENIHLSVKQDIITIASTALSQEISLVEENHVSEQSNGEVYNPPENGEVPIHEQEEEEEEEEPVAEVVDETPNESQVVVESNFKVEEAPKKSYASIVMKDTPATTPAPSLPKPVRRIQEQHLPAAPAPSSVPVSPPSGADNADDENNQEHEGDSHSVYLKNLPINVPFELVEENFKTFGPIKRGGIQIRNNKGFCFGFVEFEVADAVRSAIEASPIVIGGREVVVEEKKSTSSRGTNNRGRYPPGRGGGYRGDGVRGRGSYGGGRGYGRGDMNKKDRKSVV